MALARLHASAQAVFVGFAGLHLDEGRSVALHVVQSSLQPQRFADVGGFKHGIVRLKPVAGGAEGFGHGVSYVVEVAAALAEEVALAFRLGQFGAGGQFQGIAAEGFLHAGGVVRGGVAGVYPFVEEQVGYVAHEQRSGVLRQREPRHEVVGRVVAVVFVAFGQRTDVYQVVRFEHHEARHQCAVGPYIHVEEVELSVGPQQAAGVGELVVHLLHADQYAQRGIGHGVGGLYI